jgi:hypothetical protein
MKEQRDSLPQEGTLLACIWNEDHALQRIDVFCSVATGTPYWITAEITRRAFLNIEAERQEEARAMAEQL